MAATAFDVVQVASCGESSCLSGAFQSGCAKTFTSLPAGSRR